MSLLGLMLADVLSEQPAPGGASRSNGTSVSSDGLAQRVIDSSAAHRFAHDVRGDVVIRAGRMVVTLCFDDSGVTIERGARASARASIEGSLRALLDIASGEALLVPLVAGRVRVRGNPLVLLRLALLLRGA